MARDEPARTTSVCFANSRSRRHGFQSVRELSPAAIVRWLRRRRISVGWKIVKRREDFVSNRFANPKTMPAPRGYTQVVETTGPGRTVYLSGQLGMTPGGAFAGAPGDFRAQATQCFENLKAGLAVGRRRLRARGEDHQFLRRHVAPAGVLRGARHVREHQGAAGLDRDPGRPPGARRRAVRGRGGGGDPGQGGEGGAAPSASKPAKKTARKKRR